MEIVADNSMKNMRFIRKLPIPKEVKELYPLSEKGAAVKAQRDAEIAKVMKGESSKFLLIIGPCSADKEDSVLDYVSRLARIQEEVKDKIIIIPRIYTGKPRTTGAGYKGMIHQRIRTVFPICTQAFLPCAQYTRNQLNSSDFLRRMKCFTPQITGIFRICCHM